LISVPATKEILMTTEETVTALVAAARDGDNAARRP
jgi:hypothetical protein